MKTSTRITLFALTLCLMSVFFGACAMNVGNIDLKPSPELLQADKQYPLSVAMVTEKEHMLYIIEFTSAAAVGGKIVTSYSGLPNLFSQVLTSHFETVEPLQAGDPISGEDYDLVAKMSVDSYEGHCMVVNKGTITMTFTFENAEGETLFTKTLSATNSVPGGGGPTGCENIVAAFYKDFDGIFGDLSKALDQTDKFDDLGM